MRIAVDIGGTFTDVTVFDTDDGDVRFGKALTTPHDLTDGVFAAMNNAGAELESTTTLVHGSTVVINALVERRGARAGLVTTQGCRDVYEIGRINRPDSFNLAFRKHRPLIPRQDVYEVPERIMSDGTPRRPLADEDATALARRLVEEGYESVAVLFLHSYRNPAHERQMVRALQTASPEIFVTASHELTMEYREYERTSTVVANAYVGPIVDRYLGRLERRLSEGRFEGDLLIMQSSGGVYDVASAKRQCLQMTESGPAGGVVGVKGLAAQLETPRAICFDMGGTTAKACVLNHGAPNVSSDYFVGGYNEGLPIRIPVIDIVEVGTGGGSIGWIDEGEGVHVGPTSAGSQPGPVCYGRGGARPTITDGHLVLGHLAPDRFMGGEIGLHEDAARSAIKAELAEPLGLELEAAASGLLEIANASMANAVRAVTVQRGVDPRDFVLYAYGGGGPLHAAEIAQSLGIEHIVIPQSPGHFSALGMQLADFRRDYVATRFLPLSDDASDAIEEEFQDLQNRALGDVRETAIDIGGIRLERAADIRYVGQEHTVTISIREDTTATPENVANIKRDFDSEHLTQYGHHAPDEAAEIVSLRLAAVGELQRPIFPSLPPRSHGTVTDARRETRKAYFSSVASFVDTDVFSRELLSQGDTVAGPALIEEHASTTLVPPSATAVVDSFGNLRIELDT